MDENTSIIDRLKDVWDRVAPIRFLLTVKGNDKMVKDFFKCIKKLGLVGGFQIIESTRKKGNISQVSLDIFRSHWKAAMDSQKRFPGQTVAIFEDDCRPLLPTDKNYKEMQQRLLVALEYISTINQKKWQILNLGQVGMGPMFKIPKVPIVMTSFPFASQSYLINGYYLQQMLEKIHKKDWRFPWAVEGFLKVPLERKLAIYPNVTKQCIVPRMQKKLFKDAFTFHECASVSNNFMIVVPFIIIGLVLVIIVIAVIVIIKKKRKKQQ